MEINKTLPVRRDPWYRYCRKKARRRKYDNGRKKGTPAAESVEYEFNE